MATKIKETFKCQNPDCGKDFIPKDKRFTSYCCDQCVKTHKSIKTRKLYYENPIICPTCNTIIKYEDRETKQKYCSMTCAAKKSNENRTKESRMKQRETLLKTNGLTDDYRVNYESYRILCRFVFMKDIYHLIDGYELYLKYGFWDTKTPDIQGATLDHIFSVKNGFDNFIHPSIIGHPANCQFLMNVDNSRKQAESHITLDELKNRIIQWNEKYNDNFDINLFNIKIDPVMLPKPDNNKYDYTPIKYSSITGKIYNTKLKPATGWDNPNMVSARVLAKMFNFELGNPYETENNIISAINELSRLYHKENLTPKKIQEMFGVEYKGFNMFLINIGIETKNKKEAI
jgi:hypothetical protein